MTLGDRPKIVHIITGLSTGGAQTSLWNLLTSDRSGQFEPIVVSLRGRGSMTPVFENSKIEVHSLGMNDGVSFPAALVNLVKLLRRLKPNLLQGWMYHGNLFASLGALVVRRDMPVVWNIRHSLYSIDKEKRFTAATIKLGAFFSSRPKAIIYNSEVSARQHEAYGYETSSTVVIPNGFDCEKFRPSPEARDRLRTELKLPINAKIIGLVARYHPMKDFPNFIEAAAIATQQENNLQFVLVGEKVNRENRELSTLIESRSLTKKISLLGERKDVKNIMGGIDILSSSSWGEGFPNVLGEAMACGVPCVATNVGDSAHVIGDAGIIVTPRNPEALASGWNQILGLDESARRQLGEDARQRIVRYFSLESTISLYRDLYEKQIYQTRKK